jgi:glutamate racemase
MVSFSPFRKMLKKRDTLVVGCLILYLTHHSFVLQSMNRIFTNCIKVIPSLLHIFFTLFLMLSAPRMDRTRVGIIPVPFTFSVRLWDPEK